MDNPLLEIAQGLSLVEGVVLGFSDDGKVLVQLNGGCMVSCNAVCSNKDNPLKLDINDTVLVAQGSAENAAYYILGIIGIPANTTTFSTNELKKQEENAVSRKPVTAVVDDKRIRITAEDEIVLSCGEGSIQITKDGKITLRGTDLISRASRTNKIRGAAVRIN